MSAVATFPWFARHELRLALRDALAMIGAGARHRRRGAIIGLILFGLFLHLLAFAVMSRFGDLRPPFDRSTLLMISATLFLSWALMISQAIESVTRVFYTRADLDLILSSPAQATNVFLVRISTVALTVTLMALLLWTPFVDVLVFQGGPRWLAAFAVILSMGLSATAIAVLLTLLLFRLIGPARTRLVAQIVAAVIGAGFVIALQIVAVMSSGTLSRFAALSSAALASCLPEPASPLWWPARAITGDVPALLPLAAFAILALPAVMLSCAPHLARTAVSVAAVTGAASPAPRILRFHATSRAQSLRRKEFLLLWRDPWLLSQTLMQLLYLAPPALLLWRSFSAPDAALMVMTPVLVMAAGQLAGGLSWLTISGEDAVDLIATAPLSPRRIIGAKIEVVLIAIMIVFLPLIAALALTSLAQALLTLIAILAAAACATAIQFWFRVQARRSQFRRRQTSSRLATVAEALSSIGWAASAALALVSPASGIVTALCTLAVVAGTWKLSPRRA
ncbi:MAG: permease [Alphaproteobacteria bacterium]|nr:permease [Alphaproteobacteria bacterium]